MKKIARILIVTLLLCFCFANLQLSDCESKNREFNNYEFFTYINYQLVSVNYMMHDYELDNYKDKPYPMLAILEAYIEKNNSLELSNDKKIVIISLNNYLNKIKTICIKCINTTFIDVQDEIDIKKCLIDLEFKMLEYSKSNKNNS